MTDVLPWSSNERVRVLSGPQRQPRPAVVRQVSVNVKNRLSDPTNHNPRCCVCRAMTQKGVPQSLCTYVLLFAAATHHTEVEYSAVQSVSR